jgi:hypothetical protein
MEVAWIDTPEEWRDLLIMMYMAAGVIVFIITGIFVLLIGTVTFQVMNRIRHILRDNVQPAAVNVQGAAQNMKGTVEYVGDYAVRPVATAYGVAAGARRFIAVFARFSKKEPGSP